LAGPSITPAKRRNGFSFDFRERARRLFGALALTLISPIEQAGDVAQTRRADS